MSTSGKGTARAAAPVISVVLAAFLVLATPAVALQWATVATGGFGNTANGAVSSLQAYGGYLYAGTRNPGGCELWRYDGSSWSKVVGSGLPGERGPGFGNPANWMLYSMAVFGNHLYMGTQRGGGCELWRYDGTNLQKIVGTTLPGNRAPGFGNSNNYAINSMAVFGNRLYMGTYNGNGCELWRYDGINLEEIVGTGLPGNRAPGFADADNDCARSMAVFGSRLVIGTYNPIDGCMVWSYDGASLSQLVGQDPAGTPVTGPGFGGFANREASGMAVMGPHLYVGTENSNGCEVWRYDGAAWTKMVGQGLPGNQGPGFGKPHNSSAWRLKVYGSALYVGTQNNTPGEGFDIWKYDGSAWSQEATAGMGNTNNTIADSFGTFGTRLFVGTRNATDGGEVKEATGYTFYFAEGTTRTGFYEYLCLGNPTSETAQVNITYMFVDGTTQPLPLEVPPNSRTTILVNGSVGPDRDVSARVEADQPIVAERPMYFGYQGNMPGGHDAVGAPSPSDIWYFAEGYTGPYFDEWICVLNPGEVPANLIFDFQTQEEGLKTVTGFSVGAHSRQSFKVNQILGNNYQTSLRLRSDQPIVAERPMYFNYQGWGYPKVWPGGHCVMGATALAKEYYFAEGTTRAGFEEWLTLQNPNDYPITVNAVYQPAAGQGDNIAKSYTIGPARRHTLYVPQEIGEGKDASVKLSSASDFLAERPMYFRYTGFGVNWTGGDCAIGATRPAAEWYFAEGYTGVNFHQWLTMQNPGDSDAQVEITYYTQEAGALPPRAVTVPARTRLNLRVNDDAGIDHQLSCRLRVLSGPGIVVERPMYFNYGSAWQGGHVVVGYAP